MNIVKFIGIVSGKLKYLIILPVIAGGITFFLVKDLPKQYTSDTTVYSGITSNSGLDVTATKIDKAITQNEYSNISSILKSNSLFEEVSLRLLAQHLSYTKPIPTIISNENYQKIQHDIPAELKKLIVKGNEEETYNNLKKYVKQDENNYLYKLLNSEHPFYSTSAISKLKGEQIDGSDIFRLTYQANDPGICYNTVKISANVLIKSYGQIKLNMKSSAVKYFQNKLDEVSKKLNTAESNLLNFNIDNTIINYYEQTKQVTTQHQEIELKLQDAKMNYEASIAVLKKIEDEIGKRFSINLKNIEILKIRTQLVDCNNQIAKYEINPAENKDININSLHTSKHNLENGLKLCLDSIYTVQSSSQGIDYQKILGEWLDAVKTFENTKAMYKSMQARQVEFMLQFKRYAPLGANIKKIEREISVYEREYLDILDNLNSALQNQQNSEITSNMRIIDDAKYPISSMPSKKKLYIIISVLLTLIFFITGLFIVELMDNRINTPSLLRKLTGLEPIGGFSIQNNKKFTSAEQVTEKATAYIFEKIKSISVGHDNPFIIQILSIWDASGKTQTAEDLAESLKRQGFSVFLLNIMSIVSEQEKNNDNNDQSELRFNYYKCIDYKELIGNDYNSYDYIISVIPSVSRGIANSVLITKADISLIVYNANLTWTSADQFNTDKLKAIIKNNLFAVLASALPENLEEMYGDIPKKRSKLRVLAKKLLKRFVR